MRRYLLFFFLSLPTIAKPQSGRVRYDAVINRSQDGVPLDEMPQDDLYAKAWLYFDGKMVLYKQLLPDSTISIRSGGGNEGYSRMKFPVQPIDTIGSVYKIDYGNKIIKARMPIYNLKS